MSDKTMTPAEIEAALSRCLTFVGDVVPGCAAGHDEKEALVARLRSLLTKEKP